MLGNANTCVFFVASSHLLGLRGSMMQKITALIERNQEKMNQIEEKRRRDKDDRLRKLEENDDPLSNRQY